MPKFLMNQIIEDRITGFKGVVLGRTLYETGCTYYGVCPQNVKAGEDLDWVWLDETRWVASYDTRGKRRFCKTSEQIMSGKRTKPKGGPSPMPPQR